MALTALAVAQSGTIGYTSITQIMMYNARRDWFDKISEANEELQVDVWDTFESMAWCHDCLLDLHFEILHMNHIAENWQRFFNSDLMFMPLEGH
jgi:hypothetical protein